MNSFKLVDLCAGTGAFSYIFGKSNFFENVFMNDKCRNSKKIIEKNFDENNFVLADLNNFDIKKIPEHDILCAGFPCQPFSLAGQKKGFNDKRSNIFWRIIDIIKLKNPKIILLENVKNLKSHNKNKTFKIIIQELKKQKYYIKYHVLNTCVYSKLPQNRERIFIICFKEKENYEKFSFDFARMKNNPIYSFLETNVPEKYYYNERYKVWSIIKKNVIKSISENVVYQYRRTFVRENKNSVCPTLTANMGSGGHNVPLIKDEIGIRKLTPRECFRLQGFPDDYVFPKISDGALYKLVGNSVSLPIIKLIRDAIIKSYND